LQADNLPDFTEKFKGLIDDKFQPAGKTFVAMNAVGYNVKTCMDKLEEGYFGKDAEGKAKAKGKTPEGLKLFSTMASLKQKNMDNLPITPDKLKAFAEKCVEEAGSIDDKKKQFEVLYAGSLLMGIANALVSKKMVGTILDCKVCICCGFLAGCAGLTSSHTTTSAASSPMSVPFLVEQNGPARWRGKLSQRIPPRWSLYRVGRYCAAFWYLPTDPASKSLQSLRSP
jgi:hypothetical protein